MRVFVIAVAFLLVFVAVLTNTDAASARVCKKDQYGGWICENQDGEWVYQSDPPRDSDRDSDGDQTEGDRGGENQSPPKRDENRDERLEKVLKIDRYNRQMHDRYERARERFLMCVEHEASPVCVPPERPEYRDPGRDLVEIPDRPEFTPPEIAWQVISTQLKIPKIEPGIGPSPEANQWRMAVVGYPYWLWADGQTEASVEAEAGGLHVSLDARVDGLIFDMGDGNRVQCKGIGTPWVADDHVNDRYPEHSPTCGYVWKKLSGKGKSYAVTVSAYWRVDWTAGGQSGTEYLVDSSTRQVPVGELQAVVEG